MAFHPNISKNVTVILFFNKMWVFFNSVKTRKMVKNRLVILKKSPFTCPDLSYLHFGILEMPKWRILAMSWAHLLRFTKKYQNSWNIPQKWLDLGKDKLTLFGWKTYFLINLNFLHFGIYWKSNKQRFTFSIFYDPIIALQFLINIIMLFKWFKIGWLSWKKVHLLAQI